MDPLACASGPDDEELRYMLFNPDLSENKSWWTFFYTYKLNYLDGEVRSDSDEQTLAREWVEHLKLKAKPEEAFQALFGGLGDSSLQQNTFFREIQNNKAAREYFSLAKACEEACGYAYDPWDSDSEKEKELTVQRKKISDQLSDILLKETDDFYKKKYAFQLLKVAFYNNDQVLFAKYDEMFFQGQDKTVLDWWAMHYRAEMLDRSGDVVSANYLHARVFSHASAKMFISKQHFSREKLDSVLALATDDEARADIRVLSEVINPGRSLAAIQEIYRLKPDHRHLPLLIGREINKLENWLSSGYIMLQGYGQGNYIPDPLLPGTGYEEDRIYAAQFAEALGEMTELKSLQPEIYFLSAAYVNLLCGRAEAAETYLSRVASGKYTYQKTVLEAVLLTQQKDIAQQNVQDELGKKIGLLIRDRRQKFESQKMLFSLTSYLRYAFAKNGMIAQAGLLDNLANNKFCNYCSGSTLEYEQIEYLDHHASAEDMEQVLRMYNKPDKNALEALMLKPYANVNYIYDLLAVKYLREGETIQAYETLKKIPDSFWYSFFNANQNLDRNPFIENSELLTLPAMDVYNKREIVEQMLLLEKETEASPEKQADNYFKLGNAWYNFTANSWFVIRYGWSNYAADQDQQIDKIALSRAGTFYKKALAVEHRPENRAKLLYMMVLLNERETARQYAREYEQMTATAFYQKRNCLTTIDLAQ